MEKDKMVETVMAFSPIERQIDFYGCEIGVSRQWYNEATAILTEINEGKYLKVPEGAVVLTKEELAKHDEKVREETAKEIFTAVDKYSDKCFETVDSGIDCEAYQTFDYCKFFKWLEKFAKKHGIEVKE